MRACSHFPDEYLARGAHYQHGSRSIVWTFKHLHFPAIRFVIIPRRRHILTFRSAAPVRNVFIVYFAFYDVRRNKTIVAASWPRHENCSLLENKITWCMDIAARRMQPFLPWPYGVNKLSNSRLIKHRSALFCPSILRGWRFVTEFLDGLHTRVLSSFT